MQLKFGLTALISARNSGTYMEIQPGRVAPRRNQIVGIVSSSCLVPDCGKFTGTLKIYCRKSLCPRRTAYKCLATRKLAKITQSTSIGNHVAGVSLQSSSKMSSVMLSANRSAHSFTESREMGLARRSLDPGIAQEFSNHGKPLAESQGT